MRRVRIACWGAWRARAGDRSRCSLPRHLASLVACASRLRPVPRARATMSGSPIRAALYRLLGPWQCVPCCCCYCWCCFRFDLSSLSFPLLLAYHQTGSGHRITAVLRQSQIRRGEHPHSRATSRFVEYEQEHPPHVVLLQRHPSYYAAHRRPRSPVRHLSVLKYKQIVVRA